MKDSLTVLLVDDEERFLATTAIILQRKGINTMCATCGEEALQHMQSAPDVVVLDVRLPGMDGEATLQRMKTDFSHIPVIMLTGHGELPSAERAVELGGLPDQTHGPGSPGREDQGGGPFWRGKTSWVGKICWRFDAVLGGLRGPAPRCSPGAGLAPDAGAEGNKWESP